MENLLRLSALIKASEPLRYTPAGIPVLELLLSHESHQNDAGADYLAFFEIRAKLIGQTAIAWQNKTGSTVSVGGFLAAYSRKYPRPILHIQTIHEIN